MANRQLHAFERNRYYTGKLMTVRDFQTEQSYLNEKRHLLNRIIHGSGIVYGLQVEPLLGSADNQGILIRAGVAIDGCGREIVVSQDYNQLTDIREIDGYPAETDGDQTVYVLLSYDECSRERIHVAAKTSACCDACEANKILEGFKVKLTTTAPVQEDGLCSLLQDTKPIYKDSIISIERTVPLSVKPRDIFEIVLVATVLEQISDNLSYEITEQLPASLTIIHSDSLVFQLDNAAKNTKIEKRYTVRAGDSVDAGSISCFVNHQVPIDQFKSSVRILSSHAYHQLLIESYSHSTLISPLDQEQSGVILATLQINDQGKITQIDNSARLYVYSNPYLDKLLACNEEGFRKLPLHALTHQSGGDDPINVNGLSGMLAEPQKVNVHYENDTKKTQATGIVFGVGLAVQAVNDGMVQVSASNANPFQVFSGTVDFRNSFKGAVFLSEMIELGLTEDPFIYYGFETHNELIFGDQSEIAVTATYIKAEKMLRFRIVDNRPDPDPVSFTLRWWAVPKSKDLGGVNSTLQNGIHG